MVKNLSGKRYIHYVEYVSCFMVFLLIFMLVRHAHHIAYGQKNNCHLTSLTKDHDIIACRTDFNINKKDK